uniref:Uncharacterized protein n=1 Tax=Marmota marmota marmota TaxID=9994 RepID=A0A8C6EMD5_MARMA
MEWLLLLLSGAVLILCQSPMKGETNMVCISCDEFFHKTCRKNSGICRPRYPDFACQTKVVYSQRFTGEYVYQYSILGCPKRCVEYVRISKMEKNIFFCCNENYCNNLSVTQIISSNSATLQNLN